MEEFFARAVTGGTGVNGLISEHNFFEWLREAVVHI